MHTGSKVTPFLGDLFLGERGNKTSAMVGDDELGVNRILCYVDDFVVLQV